MATTTPLGEARRKASITFEEYGRRAGCSKQACHQWCDGSIEPPALAYQVLAEILGISRLDLMAAHVAWRREHPRRTPQFSFVHQLPPGISFERAEKACIDAIGRLAEAGAK